jgi:hypothetical protein
LLLSVCLSFLAGASAGNALPHFIKGITKERYPTPFGDGPVVDLLGGWVGLVLAALLASWAHVDRHPWGDRLPPLSACCSPVCSTPGRAHSADPAVTSHDYRRPHMKFAVINCFISVR